MFLVFFLLFSYIKVGNSIYRGEKIEVYKLWKTKSETKIKVRDERSGDFYIDIKKIKKIIISPSYKSTSFAVYVKIQLIDDRIIKVFIPTYYRFKIGKRFFYINQRSSMEIVFRE